MEMYKDKHHETMRQSKPSGTLSGRSVRTGKRSNDLRRHLLLLITFLFTVCSTMGTFAAAPALSRNCLSMSVGQQARLSVSGTKRAVKWRSNNRSVASVDQTGIVTAQKKGTAVISATVGRKKMNCSVTVKKNHSVNAMNRARRAVSADFSYTDRPGRTLIYTGIDTLDYLAEALVREIGINGKWSDEQIIKKIYTYMSKHFYYVKDRSFQRMAPVCYYNTDDLSGKIAAFRQITQQAAARGKIRYTDKFTTETWVAIGSADEKNREKERKVVFDEISPHIRTHEGVCNNHADVFSVLCAHLGIESGIAGGSAGGITHTWSWARLGGRKYYFDIGNSIHYFHSTGKVTYSCFRMKKKKMKSYRFRTEY